MTTTDEQLSLSVARLLTERSTLESRRAGIAVAASLSEHADAALIRAAAHADLGETPAAINAAREALQRGNRRAMALLEFLLRIAEPAGDECIELQRVLRDGIETNDPEIMLGIAEFWHSAEDLGTPYVPDDVTVEQLIERAAAANLAQAVIAHIEQQANLSLSDEVIAQIEAARDQGIPEALWLAAELDPEARIDLLQQAANAGVAKAAIWRWAIARDRGEEKTAKDWATRLRAAGLPREWLNSVHPEDYRATAIVSGQWSRATTVGLFVATEDPDSMADRGLDRHQSGDVEGAFDDWLMGVEQGEARSRSNLGELLFEQAPQDAWRIVGHYFQQGGKPGRTGSLEVPFDERHQPQPTAETPVGTLALADSTFGDRVADVLAYATTRMWSLGDHLLLGAWQGELKYAFPIMIEFAPADHGREVALVSTPVLLQIPDGVEPDYLDGLEPRNAWGGGLSPAQQEFLAGLVRMAEDPSREWTVKDGLGRFGMTIGGILGRPHQFGLDNRIAPRPWFSVGQCDFIINARQDSRVAALNTALHQVTVGYTIEDSLNDIDLVTALSGSVNSLIALQDWTAKAFDTGPHVFARFFDALPYGCLPNQWDWYEQVSQ